MPVSAPTTAVPPDFSDLTGAAFATMGTIDHAGRPHLSEVWFLHEDGQFKISLNTDRQKVRNLERDPGVSLLILDLENPLRYLEVRGDAVVAPDPGYAFAQRLGAKYGADLQAMDGPGGERIVATIRPEKVVTVDLSAA